MKAPTRPRRVAWLLLAYRLPANSRMTAAVRRRLTAIGAVYPANAVATRGRGHLPGSCQDLKPGKESSTHASEGHEAIPVGLLAFPERPEVCAETLTGVRAET